MTFGSWKQWALSALVLTPLLASAASLGVLTIIDGEATVLRDAVRFSAAEGLRLQADDIVRTADKTRLVRVEFDDGTAIDLGPATQALLRPRAAAAADRAPVIYMLQGWAKVSVPAMPAPPAFVWAPRIGAARIDGHAVMHVGRDVAWLFAESAAASVMPRRDAANAAAQLLTEGDSFVARGTEPGRTSRRAPAELVAQLPRALADTLPRRAARFAAVQVAPAGVAEVGYEDVAPWLNGEPVLRQPFVSRYAALATQAGFRKGLVADMALHPEWQRVVYPPEPVRPRIVFARRVPPLLPPPLAARPDTADGQWRIRIEPAADDPLAPDPPVAAASLTAEPTFVPDSPATELNPRGDTP